MPGQRNRWAVGLSVAGGALLCCAIAVLVALFGLGQVGPNTDITALPAWLWYYRADPLLIEWLKRGALAGAVVVGIVAIAILRRGPALHGTARFAREGEIRREGLRAAAGIVVGRKAGRFLIFGGSEHVLLEAPTRAGKGVGVVIPNLLTWPDSVVVLDVKRENWGASAGYRARAGQAVHLFDPLDVEGRTARYNPLAHIRRTDDTEVVNELQKIAGMLFPAPERSDPFWAEAARAAFIGVGALVASNPGLPFTIGEIYRRLTTGDPKSDLPVTLQETRRVGQRLSQACVSAIQDFASASDNTFSGIKQTITARLNLWLNPMVDAATSESDFDLREVRRRRMSIYLGVSPDNIDRIAPIYSLFLQQLVDLNTRDLPDGASNIPVLVLLDEFARLGKASVIASGFSYVAGYGLRLVPVIQSRSQLRAIYGPDVTDEIIANCGLEVVFTPKELKVANELSERLGFFTMNVKSRSRTIHGLLANRSISESDQRRALLLPQELMQLPKSELLLLRAGIPPIRGRKIAYYRMPRFTRRVIAPPLLSARPIAAMLSAPAPASAQHGAGTPERSGTQPQPATSSGGAIQEEIAMREMTDAELAGAAEITDDMLVLSDLAELPPPGDEAAAIAFVSAMVERALVPPTGPASISVMQERAAHVR
ncbi:type IV secretion system protein VirD4 [Sphingomonas laterariae]|uniref:Type IV secretion system protein VirD4 n=1 Tax=Edaphosphingomonas laterariae TaxID=861865 RepID=A0A239IQR5_9SPHN|nr:type IV secretory system conjugative DNA transfer family protein [Sphingomonas laterariae]SNS95909.1 type IV secretion system protein VirD4 [Sphingomonas laterariae]